MTVTKILLAGDIHGSIPHIRYLFDVANKEECDGLIALGDFGFWTHTKKGTDFLALCRRLIDASGIFLWWLDGNHESFDNLYELYPLDDEGVRPMYPSHHWKGPKDRENFVWPVHNPFVHLPRGYVWEWNGVRFCSFGGAYSIDKDWRLQMEGRRSGIEGTRTLWWPQERITQGELIAFTQQSIDPRIDVFLSHDCPTGVDIPTLRTSPFGPFPESDANREALKVVVDHARPRVLIHGHYHDYYESTYEGPDFDTVVIGLDCDGTGKRSWRTLNLTLKENLWS